MRIKGPNQKKKKKLVPYITKQLRVSYQFSALQPCTRMASIVVVFSIVYHQKKKKKEQKNFYQRSSQNTTA